MARSLRAMPAPRVLVKQVFDSAPWLKEAPAPAAVLPRYTRPLAALAADPYGWWRILQAARGWQAVASEGGDELVDYFTLCLACHHASVATYVPTDVDSKIRHHLWRLASSPRLVQRCAEVVVQALAWDRDGCSRRHLQTPLGALSGHDGELLSVLLAALAASQKYSLAGLQEQLQQAIEAELQRQAQSWQQAEEPRQRLLLAAILTHNAGDIDQALGYWPPRPELQAWRQAWAELASSGGERYEGAFAAAAELYRQGMAAEGHRHYPLRSLACLRRAPDLLLPFPPFLRDWGRRLAQHPAIDADERLELLAALIGGCDAVSAQRGYQQAIAGMLEVDPSLLTRLPPGMALRLRAGDLAPEIIRSEAELTELLSGTPPL